MPRNKPSVQPALPRRTFEKTLDPLVLDRAQRFGERRLFRLERLLPESRTTITGDDLQRPIRIVETVNGNFDAGAIFLNEPRNAVLKPRNRFGSSFRRRTKDNTFRSRQLHSRNR